jgi:hypothetical protein
LSAQTTPISRTRKHKKKLRRYNKLLHTSDVPIHTSQRAQHRFVASHCAVGWLVWFCPLHISRSCLGTGTLFLGLDPAFPFILPEPWDFAHPAATPIGRYHHARASSCPANLHMGCTAVPVRSPRIVVQYRPARCCAPNIPACSMAPIPSHGTIWCALHEPKAVSQRCKYASCGLFLVCHDLIGYVWGHRRLFVNLGASWCSTH